MAKKRPAPDARLKREPFGTRKYKVYPLGAGLILTSLPKGLPAKFIEDPHGFEYQRLKFAWRNSRTRFNAACASIFKGICQ